MLSRNARRLIPTEQAELSVRERASIGGCWTIDSSTVDNGFLVCARNENPGAGAHGTTAVAIDNLLGCLSAEASVKRAANIVGHGNDGIIVTGTGQNVSDLLKYISWWNHSSWQADLQRLRGRVAMVKLWACHPGAGQEGLDLLDLVCQDTEAISFGPTGFLYCNDEGFHLEPNSTWQVVTPGQPLPNPIFAPTPHRIEFTDMKIYTGSAYADIPVDQVTSIEVLSGDGSRTLTSLKSSAAQDFVRTIAFDSPFFVNGVPAAILTARIRIHFSQVAASQIGDSREFLIWNDRQLEDAANPGHFYSAPSGLRTFLRSVQ